jgi:uncharacterized OB-fold protein
MPELEIKVDVMIKCGRCGAGGQPYRNVYAFCPDCAAKAGPEWVKR